MKEPRHDPAIRSMLTRGAPRADDTAALGARVKRAASYDLFRRRHPVPSPADYIAQWSRALLPIGFVCTFAGAVILFRPHSFARDAVVATDGAALISAATNRMTTPQLVDLVLRETDEPGAVPARTSR